MSTKENAIDHRARAMYQRWCTGQVFRWPDWDHVEESAKVIWLRRAAVDAPAAF